MAVKFTLGRFPQSGELKDSCSLPFACVVQPFAKLQHLPVDTTPATHADEVGRCHECYAYINHYCHFSLYGWTCAICGGYNDYKAITNRRYIRDMGRQQAAELQPGGVEMLCSFTDDTLDSPIGVDSRSREIPGRPTYIALVDLTCGADFLELVKSGLLAALEAIAPASLFGLLTFSTKIGLYDTQGSQPSIRYVQILGEAKGPPSPLGLEEALPLPHLLAPVGRCKECITAAVDSLEAETAQNAGADGSLGTRSFGGALQAVLRCLGQVALAPDASDTRHQSGNNASTSGRDPATDFAGTRLMAFLAGPPDRGHGSVLQCKQPPPTLVPPSMTDISYTSLALGLQPAPSLPTHSDTANGKGTATEDLLQAEPNPAAQQFYEEAATAAAALGVCIDVFAASNDGVGLAYLEPLSSISGGAMFLYPSLEDAALPQDIYRRLSSPFALDGILRMRTSPEFKVTRAYGQLFQNEQYENLVHIAACQPNSTFAFDFQFTSAGGFATTIDSPPMVQMAFQYSVLVAKTHPSPPQASRSTTEDQPPLTRYVMERRMRVVTKAVLVAQDPATVYEHARPDCILCLLMHKISRAAAEEGLWNARQLLQDWLVRALANYNTNMDSRTSQAPGSALQIDATFEGAETLHMMPRLVYALLRSPLLGCHSGHHPDTRTSLRLLWSTLPPQDLQTAVYPHLSSYQDPETQAYPRHSLSRAALVTAGAPIFLLDTFTALILYYTADYPSSIPFPPPHSSLLRKSIQALKQNRQITPQLKMLRGGLDDVSQFTNNLIEEPNAMFSARKRPGMVGLVSFLEQVKFEIHQFIDHGM